MKEKYPRKLVQPEEIGDSLFWNAYTVPNPDEVGLSQDNWYDMTTEERQKSNDSWTAITLETRPENRADPKLIQVVEELGDKANGSCAKLEIVEIPDGVDWQIEEYDGNEHVAEKHRTW